jgi:hypothetical protein
MVSEKKRKRGRRSIEADEEELRRVKKGRRGRY